MNEMVERILELKKEKDVVILAHYYVTGDIQDIADYVGDSYLTAKKQQRPVKRSSCSAALNLWERVRRS